MSETDNLSTPVREPSQTSATYTFSVSGAAEACGVSTKTILRKVSALSEHGATKDMSGQWQIPLAALFAVGLHPGKPKGPDTPDTPEDTGHRQESVSGASVAGQTPSIADVRTDSEEVVQLRQAVSSLQAELDSVRRLADERIQTVADVNRQRAEFAEEHLSKLLALPAGATAAAPSPVSTTSNRVTVWLTILTVVLIAVLGAILLLAIRH